MLPEIAELHKSADVSSAIVGNLAMAVSNQLVCKREQTNAARRGVERTTTLTKQIAKFPCDDRRFFE